MHISTLYVLFAAEFVLILLGVILFLAYRLYRRTPAAEQLEETEEPPVPSYSEYLDQELQRNEQKVAQQASSDEASSDEAGSDDETARFLQARKLFLDSEKSAAQHAEDENTFWNSVFRGMKEISRQFETTRVEQVENEKVVEKSQTREKVFYVETQGKKVDEEVNKLKDIIYDQENALSSLQKSMKNAENHFPDDSDELAQLHEQMDNLERQLRDSKVCMEVLEMENQRLQDEVHKLEKSGSAGSTARVIGKQGEVNLAELKEVLDKQEMQIEHLQNTIDGLDLETSQSEKLKSTIDKFARTSQEMMGCIAILEEENDHLKEQLHNIDGDHPPAPADGDDTDTEELKANVRKLEEELIRKEVEYAKLQDEFTDMEKEYLAMYEALHGDQ